MRDDLEELIAKEAYHVTRRYHGFVEAEDVRQEMWAWCYAREKYVKGLTAAHLRWKLRDVGDGYGRREKAVRSGYSPQDEAFYSTAVLRELLPIVLAGELPTLRGVHDDDKPSARRAGASPPLEYETALIDARKAFNALPTHHREALKGHEGGGVLVSRALQAWQRKLGGKRPRP